MSNKMKNRAELVFKILISILLLYWVFRNIDIAEMYKELKQCSKGLFILAALLNILITLVGAKSLNCIYTKENVKDIFMVVFKSSFYAMVLPGQLIGEGTKILMLSKKKAKLEERVSAVFVDKLLNCVGMIALGTFGITITHTNVDSSIKKIVYLMFLAMVAVFLIILNQYTLKCLEKIINFIRLEKIRNLIIKYINQWKMYSQNRKAISKSLVWGIIYQLMVSLIYFTLSEGIGLKVEFWDYCWINTFLTIILLLPISIGGLGVRETTLVGMLALVGVESEKALLLSILVFITQAIRAVLAGGVILLEKKKESGE